MEEKLESLEASAQEDIRQGKYMTFCIGSDVFGIELKYVNEFTDDEIAAFLKIKKKTVEMRLYRAKKILRMRLGEHEYAK